MGLENPGLSSQAERAWIPEVAHAQVCRPGFINLALGQAPFVPRLGGECFARVCSSPSGLAYEGPVKSVASVEIRRKEK